jgi:hypothetical protein
VPAHSRSKNGVASLAYVAGIQPSRKYDANGRNKSGHYAVVSINPQQEWLAALSPARR